MRLVNSSPAESREKKCSALASTDDAGGGFELAGYTQHNYPTEDRSSFGSGSMGLGRFCPGNLNIHPFRRVVCAIANHLISPHSSMCPEWVLKHPMHGLLCIRDDSTGDHCPDEFGDWLKKILASTTTRRPWNSAAGRPWRALSNCTGRQCQ